MGNKNSRKNKKPQEKKQQDDGLSSSVTAQSFALYFGNPLENGKIKIKSSSNKS